MNKYQNFIVLALALCGWVIAWQFRTATVCLVSYVTNDGENEM
jgi:hypothetical protein